MKDLSKRDLALDQRRAESQYFSASIRTLAGTLRTISERGGDVDGASIDAARLTPQQVKLIKHLNETKLRHKLTQDRQTVGMCYQLYCMGLAGEDNVIVDDTRYAAYKLGQLDREAGIERWTRKGYNPSNDQVLAVAEPILELLGEDRYAD